ncbi:RNase A-like domain-containing protein [Bowmanella denitrificans]|uniref:RNase A-like domain-containing protein n=1 Tax=Bowmanella denitrificans TaxID=366582 RepID=UPI000C9D0B5D|nr:RNase A-like domain-containing protein [Bowmanella denitrificans]
MAAFINAYLNELQQAAEYNCTVHINKEIEMEEGVEVVLTPIQLAAVLEEETIEESDNFSNRLWGGVTLIAGAIELLGGAALFLVPEPTTVTKIAGGTLGLHGLDTASAGFMQVVSGKTRTTLTSQAVEATASYLGSSEDVSKKIGIAVDIGVPLLTGFAGLARAIAVRRGLISLTAEEVAGGHTIARHIGLSEAQLRARLLSQPKIPAATTFRSLRDAERYVSAALIANKALIKEWAKSATVGQTKGFMYDAGRVVGEGVIRNSGQLQKLTKVAVVIRKVQQQNRVYFVLTAYPKP